MTIQDDTNLSRFRYQKTNRWVLDRQSQSIGQILCSDPRGVMIMPCPAFWFPSPLCFLPMPFVCCSASCAGLPGRLSVDVEDILCRPVLCGVVSLTWAMRCSEYYSLASMQACTIRTQCRFFFAPGPVFSTPAFESHSRIQ